VFDHQFEMRGGEFVRKVKTLAKRKNVACRWSSERGVGSHGTLYFGRRFTIVKDLKKELGPGLLADMCKQLGIRKEEL
jgi:mRNA interferase HicA